MAPRPARGWPGGDGGAARAFERARGAASTSSRELVVDCVAWGEGGARRGGSVVNARSNVILLSLSLYKREARRHTPRRERSQRTCRLTADRIYARVAAERRTVGEGGGASRGRARRAGEARPKSITPQHALSDREHTPLWINMQKIQ
jgi:hypothetical protein